MTVLISISVMLLGLWIIWRVVNIDPQSQEKPEPRNTSWDPPLHYQCRCKVEPLTSQARARGIVLPKDFVGPTYRTKNRFADFWGDDEP